MPLLYADEIGSRKALNGRCQHQWTIYVAGTGHRLYLTLATMILIGMT